MNHQHSVPEFDMDEFYSAPTSSGQSRQMNIRQEDDDLMELVWHDGQIGALDQNRRLFPKLSPPLKTQQNHQEELHYHHPPSHRTVQPPPMPESASTTHLFMQEDEMTSWLHYPLDDVSSFDPHLTDLLSQPPGPSIPLPPVRPDSQSRPPPASLSAPGVNFPHFARLKNRVPESGQPERSKNNDLREMTVEESSGPLALRPNSLLFPESRSVGGAARTSMAVGSVSGAMATAVLMTQPPDHDRKSLDHQHRENDSQTIAECASSNPIVCEIHELKLKVTRLESALESSTEQLNARSRYAKKCEKEIEKMNHEIEDLQSVLSKLKNAEAEEERVKELEIKVNHLWEASRKNNFELYVLKSKAEEAENQLEVVASQAKQMANIVTELWIQIQQLEQALEVTKIRKAKLQKELLYRKCPFFKLIRSLSQTRYWKELVFVYQGTSTKESTWSKSPKWLTRFLSTVKIHHHQLQAVVRREMQRHDFTAPLANAELVFFVASAVILFPIMGAWILLSSQWS